MKLLLVCSISLEIQLFAKRDQEFNTKYLFLMTFPQNLEIMLPCHPLTIFWLFLTNLPLNLEDTTWEDWNTEGWPGWLLPVGELKGPQMKTCGRLKQAWGQENKFSLPNSGLQGAFPLK